MFVLLSWQMLVSSKQTVANKHVTDIAAPKEDSSVKAAPSLPAVVKITPQALFTHTQDKIEVVFNESDATIYEIRLKDFPASEFVLDNGFLLEVSSSPLKFNKINSSPEEVVFVGSDGTKEITKRFIFSKSNYSMELQVGIKNLSVLSQRSTGQITLGSLDFNPKNEQSRFQDILVSSKEKNLRPNPRKEVLIPDARFFAIRDRYFCALVEPENAEFSAFVSKGLDNSFSYGLKGVDKEIPVGGQIGHLYRVYLGPQDVKIINSINPGWASIISYSNFGIIDVIANTLVQTLGFIHSIVRNWGVAIILLSILVYFLLYPLTLKQMRSMKEMQRLQPKIEELRKAYKDNPQKLQKEMMELYREHKVNPMGGCLPMVLQMPIFFALYAGLMRSIVLKGAHFLWIKDLSEPDRLFVFSKSLPVVGGEGFNILPILMAIGMFVQQKTSMASMSSENADQQKMMLILFPILFGFIFYRMPSGLVLYWFVNSLFMLAYQIRTSRAQ